MTSCSAAKRGLCNQIGIQVRAVRLCHRAKVDPHEGHLRPELVSLVPPGLRKAIKFANAKHLLSFANPQIGVPLSVEFG